MMKIKQIKKEALSCLKGKWGMFITIMIIGSLIYSILILIGFLLLIIPGLVLMSFFMYAMDVKIPLVVLDNKNLSYSQLFNG